MPPGIQKCTVTVDRKTGTTKVTNVVFVDKLKAAEMLAKLKGWGGYRPREPHRRPKEAQSTVIRQILMMGTGEDPKAALGPGKALDDTDIPIEALPLDLQYRRRAKRDEDRRG